MEEKVLPNLIVKREEAYKQIDAQIEKGKKLRDREINSERELKQSIKYCDNWIEYNKDVLLSLFNDSSISKKYYTFSYHTHIQLDTENLFRTKDQHIQFLDNLDAYNVWVGNHINHLNNILTQYGINDMLLDTSERSFDNEIFIVHGRDDGTKDTVARFIDKLN